MGSVYVLDCNTSFCWENWFHHLFMWLKIKHVLGVCIWLCPGFHKVSDLTQYLIIFIILLFRITGILKTKDSTGVGHPYCMSNISAEKKKETMDVFNSYSLKNCVMFSQTHKWPMPEIICNLLRKLFWMLQQPSFIQPCLCYETSHDCVLFSVRRWLYIGLLGLLHFVHFVNNMHIFLKSLIWNINLFATSVSC